MDEVSVANRIFTKRLSNRGTLFLAAARESKVAQFLSFAAVLVLGIHWMKSR